MKRIASLTNVESLNCRSNGLFSQTPAKCGFNNEEGYARREFNKLCPKEQDQVIKDVYGIEESVDENPSFIRECLHRMEIELELYPGKVKRALELARNEHNSFFEDEKFRLKFLRTDKYDVKQAARRYVRFLEKKLELFGPEKLGKRITFEDLNDDDLETIRAGGIQPLPEKDRGGRVVLFTRHKNWKYNNIHNLLRAFFYTGMAMSEEVDENQGMVIISYQVGPFSAETFDRSALKKAMDLTKILPIKLAGYHFCFDDIRFRMVWGLASVFIGKDARLRARDHEGTHVECRYGLMSYGIPVESMPITVDGDEDNSNILKWIEERKGKSIAMMNPPL